jgi:hypothetical protein
VCRVKSISGMGLLSTIALAIGSSMAAESALRAQEGVVRNSSYQLVDVGCFAAVVPHVLLDRGVLEDCGRGG